ncbi:unnamed protein product [Rhizophagus irregularis]|nr:unnamed protein product [Rhizophagus irregularis]
MPYIAPEVLRGKPYTQAADIYSLESLRYISVSEIEEAENYRNLHLSTLKGDRKITTHPQAVYTSRLLNPFTECLDCAITD